jgi:hypothetical protein
VTDHFLYFAYGSNLHPRRLRERSPSASVIGPALLPGHRLRFHKLGLDGSAKCDARHTGNPDHMVQGVVYRIEERHRTELDRAESLGTGYDARLVELRSDRGSLSAWCYHACDEAIVGGLRPFDWYLDYVVAGARHHGLPEHYIDALKQVPSRPDPQASRSALNRAILADL